MVLLERRELDALRRQRHQRWDVGLAAFARAAIATAVAARGRRTASDPPAERKSPKMSCKIRRNRHGFLAYRLYWDGHESHERTGLRDTPTNRPQLVRRAAVMSDEITAGASTTSGGSRTGARRISSATHCSRPLWRGG